MAQTIVTTLSPEELADLLAPRLAERLEAEWERRERRRARGPRPEEPSERQGTGRAAQERKP
jgi:hypothetical protein